MLIVSVTMLDRMTRRSRSVLCLSLTSLALSLSVLAFCTSYWCEGTHKVVKPLCLSAVKMEKCGQNSSHSSSTGETPTVPPSQEEEVTSIQQKQSVNAVQYIWETGEDKYTLRYFHTGFWESCEKHSDGERCRRFFDLTPDETHGVLWLSMISEFMYISLMGMGYFLMWLEVLCFHNEMLALRINSFAALFTVLSGLIGMVAHMMYTTVFQLTVIVGPKDWRPQSWEYGWSFALAWVSFSCCMGAAVLTLNSYTKTHIELHRRQRLQQEQTRAAPSYEEVVLVDEIYSVHSLLQGSNRLLDSIWTEHGNMGRTGEGEVNTEMLVEGCWTQQCEDCEREMDEMEESNTREEIDSPC